MTFWIGREGGGGGKGREGKGREGKGREGKGREGKGREGPRRSRLRHCCKLVLSGIWCFQKVYQWQLQSQQDLMSCCVSDTPPALLL